MIPGAFEVAGAYKLLAKYLTFISTSSSIQISQLSLKVESVLMPFICKNLCCISVQCNGQLLRSPDNGRIDCPQLTSWIAEAGERCRLKCDSGYTPSVSQVLSPRLFLTFCKDLNFTLFLDHMLRLRLVDTFKQQSSCFKESGLCIWWSDNYANHRAACRWPDTHLYHRIVIQVYWFSSRGVRKISNVIKTTAPA